MGYRSLRVINDDRISPGKGFGMHPHSSMEIFTYIIAGRLEHKDSMGHGRVIKAGEFQYMSAGSGVMHSEFNPSKREEVHLLQIWITPKDQGGDPRYADMDANARKKRNALTLLASGDGREDSCLIRQDAEIYFGQLDQRNSLPQLPDGSFRSHYLHLVHGRVFIGGQTLRSGDAVMIEGKTPAVTAKQDAEFLFFNL